MAYNYIASAAAVVPMYTSAADAGIIPGFYGHGWRHVRTQYPRLEHVPGFCVVGAKSKNNNDRRAV
jgi:hypothetical protein